MIDRFVCDVIQNLLDGLILRHEVYLVALHGVLYLIAYIFKEANTLI